MVDKCVRDEADLQTLIHAYVGRPDDADDATTKLPAKGQEYGRVYAPLLDQLKNAQSDFRSNESYVRFDISVSSIEPWYDVRDKYKDAASPMMPYWRDRYAPVDTACKRLALGEKHPDIEAALRDLQTYTGNVKQTVRQLKIDYNAWLASARKVREMTDQDHKELREVMCTKGVDLKDIEQKANAVAKDSLDHAHFDVRTGRDATPNVSIRANARWRVPESTDIDAVGAAWVDLQHEIVEALGAKHGVIVTATNEYVLNAEVWLSLTSVDGRVMHQRPNEISSYAARSRMLGNEYVRHPRWGARI